jgi:mannose-6-phosphate isomerase-like protein (cupin superfamily)
LTADSPYLLGPGEGDRPRGREFTIKCGREELVLVEVDHTAGESEPEPHIHRLHADAFLMLEGELLVRVGDGEHLVGPGDFVFAPPGLVHSYRSPGSERCRFINIHAPGMGYDERLRGRIEEFDQHPPPGDGGRPASEGVLLRRGEGEPLDLGPAQGRIKAGMDDGLGSVAVVEVELAPESGGPPPHSHARLTDSFYVLDGTLTVLLGDEEHEAPAGSYALVAPGNVHTVSNPGREPVRFLNVSVPGGLDRYLRELAAADPADFPTIAARHDVIVAPGGPAAPASFRSRSP